MGEAVHTLSIIIPAYNEEKTIAELLQRVLDANLGTGIERELIVVNDCSTDSTEQIVEDFIAHHADAPIVYLKHERNYGKGMAVRTGIRAVTGDYIVMQDADLEVDTGVDVFVLCHCFLRNSETKYRENRRRTVYSVYDDGSRNACILVVIDHQRHASHFRRTGYRLYRQLATQP